MLLAAHPILDLEHLHSRVAPDDVAQNARVVRSQMLHQHKRHARGGIGCNGLKGEALPPATHPCWKSRKSFIKECSRFVAEFRLRNFQKYKTHVENVLKKRAGL
jgi:hypothetical protein